MPVRLLREGILDSDAVCSLTFPAEVFYRRLMSVVDDFGRFDGRPAVLRSRLYPLQADKVREADIPRWIAECEKAGLIVLYTVAGKQYILFRKLGVPRAKESKWPPPPPEVEDENPHGDEGGCLQTLADENGCEQTLAGAPYSDSGSLKPPNPPAGGGGGGKKTRRGKTRGDPASVPIPPSLDTPEFRQAWADWLAARGSMGKPVSEIAAKQQLADLAEVGPVLACECIRTSIRNQWQGIFTDRVRGRQPQLPPPVVTPPPVPDRDDWDMTPRAKAKLEQKRLEREAAQREQQQEAAHASDQ